VVGEVSGLAVEGWMRVGLMFVSPAVVTDDDRVAHGNSRRRVHRRGHQHRVCQGQDLRCLRHHCRCHRRPVVICMRAVDCKMVLEMETAEQDLLGLALAETCQSDRR
jgi:hypothetical protein